MDLSGKTRGAVTARAVAGAGGHVIVACRDVKAEAVASDIGKLWERSEKLTGVKYSI
jgi:NAD(P)-dependent dehydrogenase (short-subunit alcohol dehydrogenase family)